MRVEYQHLSAVKIQTQFRRWCQKETIDRLCAIVIKARYRRWRTLHKRMEYCPVGTPGSYGVCGNRFFRTRYLAKRYLKHFVKTGDFIWQHVQCKRMTLINRAFQFWNAWSCFQKSEIVSHIDETVGDRVDARDENVESQSIVERYLHLTAEAQVRLQQYITARDHVFDEEDEESAYLNADTGYYGKISALLIPPENNEVLASELPLAIKRKYEGLLSAVADVGDEGSETDLVEGVEGDEYEEYDEEEWEEEEDDGEEYEETDEVGIATVGDVDAGVVADDVSGTASRQGSATTNVSEMVLCYC